MAIRAGSTGGGSNSGRRSTVTVCPLVRWAAGHPFVWLDDEITDADRRWVRAHHEGRALLHRADPLTGVTEADFAAIRRWLAA
ncbi:hypothetical protein [Actinoplanes sp. G11-F43]|uniref:hypothetical protein n=1 Tax=Actinoplanes sp. G11-F43 TaxID=3424130 RepID=UPI003D343CA9